MNNQKIKITVPKIFRTFSIPAIKDGLPTMSGSMMVEFHSIRHEVRTIFSLKINGVNGVNGVELNNIILTKKDTLKKSDFMSIEDKFGKRIAEEIKTWLSRSSKGFRSLIGSEGNPCFQ